MLVNDLANDIKTEETKIDITKLVNIFNKVIDKMNTLKELKEDIHFLIKKDNCYLTITDGIKIDLNNLQLSEKIKTRNNKFASDDIYKYFNSNYKFSELSDLEKIQFLEEFIIVANLPSLRIKPNIKHKLFKEIHHSLRLHTNLWGLINSNITLLENGISFTADDIDKLMKETDLLTELEDMVEAIGLDELIISFFK